MRCPYCDSESSVLDSRVTADGVRRRRACPECKRRFTTYEKAGAPNFKVIKRSGKTEPFDSNKLARTLARVCRDRPNIADIDIVRIARSIEGQLLDDRPKSVESSRVVEMVLEKLIELDKLAYDRLAVNYMSEDGQLRTRGAVTHDTEQLGLFVGAPENSDD